MSVGVIESVVQSRCPVRLVVCYSRVSIWIMGKRCSCEYEPSKPDIVFTGRIGASLFCSLLRYMSLYFSGMRVESVKTGINSSKPVSGGDNASSLARCATTSVRLPPAEVPPTMKPALGSAPSEDTLAAAHFVTSQQSLGAAGNGFSGASR